MPIEVSHSTKFIMDELQIAALAFMAIVYFLKIRWLLSFPAGKERTPARGDHGKAIRYAYATLAMPWELPGTRVHWIHYIEFAVFHIAVAVAIALTLIMPYWPTSRRLARDGPGPAGRLRRRGRWWRVSRLLRRILRADMRDISSPGRLLLPGDARRLVRRQEWPPPRRRSEPALVAFFGLTAFFLVYVPFSKISHYIYWPFIRYYMGKHFGHRGVYPTKAVPAPRVSEEGSRTMASQANNAAPRPRPSSRRFKKKLNRQAVLSLAACVHCGMCNESCHYYLATGDPKMTPAYKIDQIRKLFKYHVDWLGRSRPAGSAARRSRPTRTSRRSRTWSTARAACAVAAPSPAPSAATRPC